MIVGSIKENITLEKRVSVTPESAKNIIGLGLKLCIEKGNVGSQNSVLIIRELSCTCTVYSPAALVLAYLVSGFIGSNVV